MQEMEFTVGQIRAIECLKEGWEMIKPHYWIFFAITLVGILIASLIPFGLGIGAMYCGIYYVLFRLVEGKPPDFSDLFKGFGFFLPALISTMILVIPIIVFTLIIWISMAGIMFSMTDSHGQISPSAIGAIYGTMFAEGVVMGLVLGCIHAFIIFTYPLIVERNLNGLEAFKLSAKAAWANLGGVISLILAQFALGFVGYLACFVGVYLTLPVMFAGVFVAYRRVFPSIAASHLVPPPPSAYQGLS